jgi:hypothetical protein
MSLDAEDFHARIYGFERMTQRSEQRRVIHWNDGSFQPGKLLEKLQGNRPQTAEGSRVGACRRQQPAMLTSKRQGRLFGGTPVGLWADLRAIPGELLDRLRIGIVWQESDYRDGKSLAGVG